MEPKRRYSNQRTVQPRGYGTDVRFEYGRTASTFTAVLYTLQRVHPTAYTVMQYAAAVSMQNGEAEGAREGCVMSNERDVLA